MSLVDSIIGAESGGNPNATNPNSSASGPGQFIDSTWLATVRAHRPDLADKSDAEILGMKTDPALGRQMTEAYAQDNQAILSKASVPVTPGSTYLAHFAGPGGAVKVLQADPGTPVGQILGDAAVKANPFLRGMTAADLQAWADRKMGSAPAAAPAQPQQVAQATPAPQQVPLSIPQGQAPVFPQAAPQAAQVPGGGGDFSVPQAPPIFYAPRRAPDLSGLQQALGNRGLPFFARG